MRHRQWTKTDLWILTRFYSQEPVAAVAERLDRSRSAVQKKAGLLVLVAFDQRTSAKRHPVKKPEFDPITRLAVCGRWA